MNRRVLLIDADTTFRDTLTRELGRYKGVVVMTESDGDRAFALAAADAPSLIIIAVEEPDKTGYKIFQKCKKGALSKIPVLLITSSVSADSFAKHRGLKVHADEYIDKRDMSTHELVGKIDNLIVLGEPADDEVSIPVEDDIPMEIADGDVVVDETMAGDDDASGPSDFADEARTVGGNEQMLDQLVDAETDAAFASLLGSEVPASGPSADAGAIPEPVPHTIEDHSDEEPPADHAAPRMVLADMESVPTPVHDGGREPSENFETVSRVGEFEDEGAAIHDAPPQLDHEQPVEPEVHAAHEEPVEQAEHVEQAEYVAPAEQVEPQIAGPLTLESSPAIQLDDSELEAIDDDIPIEEVADDLPPEDHVDHVEPAPVAMPSVRAQSEPVITSAPRPDAATRRAGRESSGPRLVDTAQAPREVHEAATVMAAPIIADEARPDARPKFIDAGTQSGVRGGSGSHPAIDLGLEAVAQDADREQSGVYDRKSLRKIGELERQIAQLKTELERARAQADSAAKGAGRESQFLNLREANLAKDKELKQLRADFDAQATQLAELLPRIEQVQHAKTALEAKNTQLEERLLAGDSSAKAELAAARSEHETAVADHATKLARAEQDAQAKLAAVEAARAALETELAAEKDRRTASASEAERTLRAEREQLLGRHQAELATVRADAEAAVAAARSEADAAVSAARSEAGGAIAAAREDVEQKLGATKASAEQQIASVRDDAEQQIASAKAAAEAQLTQQLAAARADAETALQQQRGEAAAALEAALQQQREELEAARAAAVEEAVEELRRANVSEHQDIVAGMEKRHATEIVALKADLAEARTSGDRALAELRARHAAELEQIATKHSAALELIEEEHQDQRERDSQSQAAALTQLKQELDRSASNHDIKLAAAKAEVDELIAKHEAHKGELHAQHQNAFSTLQQAHDTAVAKLHEEREQLADDARRAALAHKAALAEAQTAHDSELTQIQAAAHREVGDAKQAMLALKKTADEMIAKLHADRADLEKAHAAAIAEIEAKQERALAVANGDFLKQKGVSDAEHAKQLAALTAEHATQHATLTAEHQAKVAEAAAERDELKRGLSSARDTIKRSESELASAVQTIADRNGELRSHAAAIAERDQRIVDLRTEIEAIEAENTSYQEQVLRAYQKIKSDEAMVARARKAMAIALTVLDDQGNPPTS